MINIKEQKSEGVAEFHNSDDSNNVNNGNNSSLEILEKNKRLDNLKLKHNINTIYHRKTLKELSKHNKVSDENKKKISSKNKKELNHDCDCCKAFFYEISLFKKNATQKKKTEYFQH